MNEIAGIVSFQKEIQVATSKTLAAYFFKEEKELSSASFLDVVSESTFSFSSLKIAVIGRIYNENELRQAFPEMESSSPAEIIYRAYNHWGEKFIHHLNGIFIIVIVDEQQQIAKIYTDHLGKLPLYYLQKEDQLVYSTSLKSLRSFVDGDKNVSAIQSYFRRGFISAPQTIYANIFKMEPGSCLTFSNTDLSTQKYWKISDKVKTSTQRDEKVVKAAYQELLEENIKSLLNPAKKTGIFLSGGIDSSLVTAISQSLSSAPLPTFSIAFEDENWDEGKYARQIAEKLGTIHHEKRFTSEDVRNLLLEFPKWYEEPYADSSGFPTYVLAEFAKAEVDEIFTGDGGDEQFLGYGMHVWAERLNNLHPLRKVMYSLLNLSPKPNHQRASEYFNYRHQEEMYDHIFSVDQGYFSERQLQRYFHFSSSPSIMELEEVDRRLFPSERQALQDLTYYLPGDLLPKVERVTRKHHLFAHSPLLDYRLVEQSLNIDKGLKWKDGKQKYLLQSLLFDSLPKELFNRPKKGFNIPLAQWLRKDLKPLLDTYVNPAVLAQKEFYNVATIMELKKEFLSGKTYLFHQIWLIMLYNIWSDVLDS